MRRVDGVFGTKEGKKGQYIMRGGGKSDFSTTGHH